MIDKNTHTRAHSDRRGAANQYSVSAELYELVKGRRRRSRRAERETKNDSERFKRKHTGLLKERVVHR